MKINEELERLLGTEAFRRQQPKSVGSSGADGFEGLLTRQLQQNAESTGPLPGADPDSLRLLADPLRLANASVASLAGNDAAGSTSALPADADMALVEALGSGMSAALDGFDRYASSLNGSASLKDAWGALSTLEGQIKNLRQDMGKLSKPDAQLDSMLNEMEVLATTEKFKLNRGDYL